MFVKHIIKTLHVSITIVWPSSGGRLSCLVLLLPPLFVCVVKLFIWYVTVCCLCVCVPGILVCGMFGCELSRIAIRDSSQPNIPQTSTSGRHTHRQHTATYQINNLTTQTNRGGSNSTKHERRPPEDGQTIVTETCRVLMMCFTNIFNNLEF
jgi:hypothetical protein